MRVAVIENMEGTPLGQVGVALREADATIEIYRPWAGEALPSDAGDHDALVVLGGEQNALDDEKYPYLPELAGLMRRFADKDKAVLGVCLGSQLLARAYGGENRLRVALEFGWHDVAVTPEGASDPLLAAVGPEFTTFQWHFDTFELPEGAVRLATNGMTQNQAFRIGRAAYGTQFHFEASTQVVEEWKVRFAATIDRMVPDWRERHPELAALHGAGSDAAGLEIARAWVRLIPQA